MSIFAGQELQRLERQYAEGIKSGEVVEVFRAKGHRFSEATLRKYVQLGLLPKSRRIGVRGRHRGSMGVYPVSIIRLVNDIKSALDGGSTLEEVRLGCVGLSAEVNALRMRYEEVSRRFEEALVRIQDRERQGELTRRLRERCKIMHDNFRELDALAVRIGGRST